VAGLVPATHVLGLSQVWRPGLNPEHVSCAAMSTGGKGQRRQDASYRVWPRGRNAKYSENRDFAPEPTGLSSKIKRHICWLDPKFVTRRINGIFSPIKEFRPA